jgi:hypothetical protein
LWNGINVVCERKIVNQVVHLCGWIAAYILFILILNTLQHIYGIMASVLDTVVFRIVPKVAFP